MRLPVGGATCWALALVRDVLGPRPRRRIRVPVCIRPAACQALHVECTPTGAPHDITLNALVTQVTLPALSIRWSLHAEAITLYKRSALAGGYPPGTTNQLYLSIHGSHLRTLFTEIYYTHRNNAYDYMNDTGLSNYLAQSCHLLAGKLTIVQINHTIIVTIVIALISLQRMISWCTMTKDVKCT